jgi:ABC-2 type transport system permease protein
MSATEHAPPLREVPGPSAFGGGAKRFLTLTWLLAATDFKLSYFETVFGYLWSLMRPLMTFGVLYVVFTKILRFGDQVPHYAALLLFNVMLFTFFSESTTRAVSCVVESENVVRKMQFPRLAIPTSVVLTGLFNLGLNLIVVLIFLLASGVTPRLTWLALPGLVALLVALTAGVATLVAALYVRFRDIAPIWGVVSLVIFYASPILYPVETIPHSLRFLLFVNPFAPLFEAARRLLVDPGAPTVTDAAGSVWGVIGPSLVALTACAVGLLVFTRAAPRIAEEL